MPTSVALLPHFEAFVKAQLESGRYNNASEVIRDGSRLLEDREQLRALKFDALRDEIRKGLASGQSARRRSLRGVECALPAVGGKGRT